MFCSISSYTYNEEKITFFFFFSQDCFMNAMKRYQCTYETKDFYKVGMQENVFPLQQSNELQMSGKSIHLLDIKKNKDPSHFP